MSSAYSRMTGNRGDDLTCLYVIVIGITLSEFFLEDNNKTVMLNEQQLRLIYYAAKLNPEQYDSLLQFLELL